MKKILLILLIITVNAFAFFGLFESSEKDINRELSSKYSNIVNELDNINKKIPFQEQRSNALKMINKKQSEIKTIYKQEFKKIINF